MALSIHECRDSALLAQLNRDVQTLHAKLYPELFRPYDREAMEALFVAAMAQEHYLHWVIWQDDKPLGYMQVERRIHPGSAFKLPGALLYVHQVCVVREHQGEGVGHALLEHLFAYAREQGIHRVELDVWARNDTARAFFQAHGFRTFNERMCMEW